MNNLKDLFKDLQVLELASVLAGPLVGSFLSECGAKVLKVENLTTRGDITRKWKTPEEADGDCSTYFASCNINKKSIFLDYSVTDHLDRVKNLVRESDIVIVNFKQGDDNKWALDYESLKALKPDLIYIKITGFGDEDVRTAYDVILQAETGIMSMNGYEGHLPCKLPLAFIDVIAAHHAKEGVLIALIKKMKTGLGSLVQVSLYDAAITSLINQATTYLNTGEVPKMMGSSHPNIAPYGDVFLCLDQSLILFGIGTDQQFISLCDVLDMGDEFVKAFKTNALRVRNRKLLLNTLQDKIKDWKRDNLYYELLHLKVPVARIRNLKEVFDDNASASLILTEITESGTEYKKPTTLAFKIS